MAPAAKAVVGTELYELTAVTSQNFPCIDGSKSSSHAVLGDARAGIKTCTCKMQVQGDCRVEALEVKTFFVETRRIVVNNPEETKINPENPKKPGETSTWIETPPGIC
jgi:hypothetical protein